MGASGWIVGVNLALTVTRLGALIGVARAYEWRPWTYWFSPLLDLPVALRLITSTLRRRQVWRGRVYVRRAGGILSRWTDPRPQANRVPGPAIFVHDFL